jgi:hypothetical protein
MLSIMTKLVITNFLKKGVGAEEIHDILEIILIELTSSLYFLAG